MLQSSGAPAINARTGRHDCWDRLVIDFNGTPAPGYDVRYVDAFHEGNLNSGAILPLRSTRWTWTRHGHRVDDGHDTAAPAAVAASTSTSLPVRTS